MAGRSSHELDITNGRIFPKYLTFIIPMALSYMLQIAFNAADVIVVGRFNGPDALAAVGSTTALVSLIVNFIVGLSNGVNIVIARDYAAERFDKVSDEVHTAVLSALIGGILFGIIGAASARPILELMKSPDNVIDMSSAYLSVYYIGLPGLALYNFASAILRAIGDTKRPMNFLIVSGVLNVILNLFFVIVLNMGVVGVGIATTVSSYVSAILVLGVLVREDSCLKLNISGIRIKKDIFAEIMKQGVPVGLQGSIFSISNILIQSAVNSFGSVYMAGNAASQNIESFLQCFVNANMNTVLTFTSQNVGAHKYKRADRTIRYTLLWGMAGTAILGVLIIIFRYPFLSLYTTSQDVVDVAVRRLIPIVSLYALGIMMDTSASALRGFGYSVEPMVITLIGSCVFRIIWLNTVFRILPYYEVIIIVWPVSWVVTFIANYIYYKKIRKNFPDEDI